MESSTEKKYNTWIVILSIAIPLVVALLFGVNLRNWDDVKPSFLPLFCHFNGITAVVSRALFLLKTEKEKA